MLSLNLGFNRQQTEKLQHGDEFDKKVSNVLDDLITKNTRLLKQAFHKSQINKLPIEERKSNLQTTRTTTSKHSTSFIFDDDYHFLKKMKMKDLEVQMSTLIPIIKIEDAKFLIGAEAKMLEIK